MKFKEKYLKEVIPKMTKEFGYKTPMAVPRVLKVSVNSGTGRIRDKKDAIESVVKFMALITGQKASPRPTKKAISSFKTREGMIVGFKVTLRGKKMYDFIERLVDLALPRTRDFRGISPQSIDEGGSLTLGIKEHIVFPETIGEDVKNIFGLQVTVVTNAKSRKEAESLFRLLGFPLKHV
ncbi:MAG: 50S ribosomal protein L5 [Patescibacteria group bacterium]